MTGSPFLQKEVWQRAGHLTWTQYAAANNTRCDIHSLLQRESEGRLYYVVFVKIPFGGWPVHEETLLGYDVHTGSLTPSVKHQHLLSLQHLPESHAPPPSTVGQLITHSPILIILVVFQDVHPS